MESILLHTSGLAQDYGNSSILVTEWAQFCHWCIAFCPLHDVKLDKTCQWCMCSDVSTRAWNNISHRICRWFSGMLWIYLIYFPIIFRVACLALRLVLKIRSIRHARDLWKLVQCCEQFHLLSLSDPWNLPGYCLTQWISKLPGSFEIHWVRQYLVL